MERCLRKNRQYLLYHLFRARTAFEPFVDHRNWTRQGGKGEVQQVTVQTIQTERCQVLGCYVRLPLGDARWNERGLLAALVTTGSG